MIHVIILSLGELILKFNKHHLAISAARPNSMLIGQLNTITALWPQ